MDEHGFYAFSREASRIGFQPAPLTFILSQLGHQGTSNHALALSLAFLLF
jgi:hypothetical protein